MLRLPVELVEAVADRQAVLFVGAGVSAAQGVPTFDQLVDALALRVGYDPDLFKLHGDLPTLADYVKRQLATPDFERLLSELADRFKRSDAAIRRSLAHRLIVELNFPLIYTTNYDDLIEVAYRIAKKPLKVIATIEDLKGVDSSVPQLIKYHGDFAIPSTIVLTESDYFDRLDLNSPLDVRFRSDVLGRSVLFIGYSLSDINLRYFLYRLSQLWKAVPQAAPRSYLVVPQQNPIQTEVLAARGVETVVADAPTFSQGLKDVLTALNREVKRRRPLA